MSETTQSSSAPPVHRNNLNFLRLVLATLVILSHSPEIIDGNRHREILTRIFHTLSFGELAVDGFFILSGYLIVQSWLRSKGWTDYLKKRAFRIYPGFLVAYLFSVLVVGALGATNVPEYFRQIDWFNNLGCLLTLNPPPHTNGTFTGLAYPYVNGALWTILYEFGCYLVVMALGLTGVLRQRGLVAGLFALLLLLHLYISRHGFAASVPIPYLGSVTEWPRFLTYFLAGSCCYLYRDKISYQPRWAAIALIVLIPAMFKHLSVTVCLPTLGAYLLFYLGFMPAERLARIGTKVDLSYGLYLYAWPVQMLLVWYFRHIDPWSMFLLAWGIANGLAWLSWTFVEKRALALKRRPT